MTMWLSHICKGAKAYFWEQPSRYEGPLSGHLSYHMGPNLELSLSLLEGRTTPLWSCSQIVIFSVLSSQILHLCYLKILIVFSSWETGVSFTWSVFLGRGEKQCWLFTTSSMCSTEMMKKKKYSLQHFCLYTGVAHMMCMFYI